MRKTRKQKKQEEKEILAQMEQAMAERTSAPTQPSEQKTGDEHMPKVLHCKRCKTLMENGVCPLCGYRVYMTMDKKKRDKIRWIVTGVCVALFIVILLLTK